GPPPAGQLAGPLPKKFNWRPVALEFVATGGLQATLVVTQRKAHFGSVAGQQPVQQNNVKYF
ncbi:MAG: hypothetical protein VX257_03945, partial [Planctomycetota bacterium]|nr:hypothetical protein [Planctomycetota bacterium]